VLTLPPTFSGRLCDHYRIDPDIPYLLKSLTLMCRVFTDRWLDVGPLEWNARLDPHATAIVYNAAVSIQAQSGWM
jgi:inosine-uridine nucleoside N-ribohydrolase